jgi:hypothetical protein
MSESGEKDVFEAMVDKVLAYRPKKAKRKKRRVKSAKKKAKPKKE